MEEAADKSTDPVQDSTSSLSSVGTSVTSSLSSNDATATPSLGSVQPSATPSLGSSHSRSQPPVLEPSSSLPGTMTSATPSLGSSHTPQSPPFPRSDFEPEKGSDGEALAKFSSGTTSLHPRPDLGNESTTSSRVFSDVMTSQNVHDPTTKNLDPPRDDDETSAEDMRHDDIAHLHKKRTIMSSTGNRFSSEKVVQQGAPAVDIAVAAPGPTPRVTDPLPRDSHLS